MLERLLNRVLYKITLRNGYSLRTVVRAQQLVYWIIVNRPILTEIRWGMIIAIAAGVLGGIYLTEWLK